MSKKVTPETLEGSAMYVVLSHRYKHGGSPVVRYFRTEGAVKAFMKSNALRGDKIVRCSLHVEEVL